MLTWIVIILNAAAQTMYINRPARKIMHRGVQAEDKSLLNISDYACDIKSAYNNLTTPKLNEYNGFLDTYSLKNSQISKTNFLKSIKLTARIINGFPIHPDNLEKAEKMLDALYNLHMSEYSQTSSINKHSNMNNLFLFTSLLMHITWCFKNILTGLIDINSYKGLNLFGISNEKYNIYKINQLDQANIPILLLYKYFNAELYIDNELKMLDIILQTDPCDSSIICTCKEGIDMQICNNSKTLFPIYNMRHRMLTHNYLLQALVIYSSLEIEGNFDEIIIKTNL